MLTKLEKKSSPFKSKLNRSGLLLVEALIWIGLTFFLIWQLSDIMLRTSSLDERTDDVLTTMFSNQVLTSLEYLKNKQMAIWREESREDSTLNIRYAWWTKLPVMSNWSLITLNQIWGDWKRYKIVHENCPKTRLSGELPFCLQEMTASEWADIQLATDFAQVNDWARSEIGNFESNRAEDCGWEYSTNCIWYYLSFRDSATNRWSWSSELSLGNQTTDVKNKQVILTIDNWKWTKEFPYLLSVN